MESTIVPSFPATMLHTNQRAVKDVAQMEPVLITCSDNRNLVMTSRQLLSQQLASRQEENIYEQAVFNAILEAQMGIALGDYVVGVDEAIAESERMRLARG